MSEAPKRRDAQPEPFTWEAAARQNAKAAYAWFLKYEAAQDIALELLAELEKLVAIANTGEGWPVDTRSAEAVIAKFKGETK